MERIPASISRRTYLKDYRISIKLYSKKFRTAENKLQLQLAIRAHGRPTKRANKFAVFHRSSLPSRSLPKVIEKRPLANPQTKVAAARH